MRQGDHIVLEGLMKSRRTHRSWSLCPSCHGSPLQGWKVWSACLAWWRLATWWTTTLELATTGADDGGKHTAGSPSSARLVQCSNDMLFAADTVRATALTLVLLSSRCGAAGAASLANSVADALRLHLTTYMYCLMYFRRK